MDNYKNMYYYLFNKITDFIEEMKTVQQLSEEMFITVPEDNTANFPTPPQHN